MSAAGGHPRGTWLSTGFGRIEGVVVVGMLRILVPGGRVEILRAIPDDPPPLLAKPERGHRGCSNLNHPREADPTCCTGPGAVARLPTRATAGAMHAIPSRTP
jgi:hypothetical protein